MPAVLTLYAETVERVTKVKHMRKLATSLRDSLNARFLGIFTAMKMAYSLTPDKDPFSSKVYLVAAILDPNVKLEMVDDTDIDDLDKDLLKSELKSKLMALIDTK